ncbi:Chaoptin [Papilio xuthus]|uniref:Chaoptin n=2 Tax=Papilio xuthus TaxID=66420 RepID=A0A194PTT8_PAPXU|nr:Chaoptin [Papilio xuthus]
MFVGQPSIISMRHWWLCVLLTGPVFLISAEYIPPGPAYPCPKDAQRQLLYPCTCENGTDAGLHIRCENVGLAVLSVGLGNIAGLGLPIERLELRECKIGRLFGALLRRVRVRVLHMVDTPLRTIDEAGFEGVNSTLQELYMRNTEIATFPKEAFRILGNLSILSIDGHLMQSLAQDIFVGSAAAGSLLRLHLPNGLLADIPPEAFQHLKKLRTLDLHGNRLSALKRNQFRGLRDLELLDLSYNNITKLDGSHMGDLTKLGWCNASHNLIADIPRGMFARNTVIKVVHLDNNRLRKLDTNAFRGMRFLRRLYLQDNQIAEVGRGTFAAVTRIGTVDLARNLITKVDFQMFQQVKYAEIINLAENQISVIEQQAFTDLYQAVVNVSHNALADIEVGAFQNCNNLTALDLSHNRLAAVPRGAFDLNTYAFVLDVSHNRFEDFMQIPIQNMSGLSVLNASHNALRDLPKQAFPKLYELHTVDLAHNNISLIGNAAFQNLFSLRYLNLSHNALERIGPAAFGALATLLRLQASHNGLRDLSRGALARLASCRNIDLSHNRLDTIFQIPISLSELDLSYNNLTEVRSKTWPPMNALLSLELEGNRLGEGELPGDAFVPLLTLQRLGLARNGLAAPPWQALNALSSLQYLHLQYNNITTLSKSAFGNLPTTFEVDLSYNALEAVAPGAFRGLPQLLRLRLAHNRLAHLPNGALQGLVALRQLDLSHNALERIDNKTHGLLDDCLSLEEVDLSHNQFGSLSKKTFPSSPWVPYRLRVVDLSHNRLPVLTADLAHGTRTLLRLRLDHNYIDDIRHGVLANLTALQHLDLSHNRLRDLVSRTSEAELVLPRNLSDLVVSDNLLRRLPLRALLAAPRLRRLDVRRNALAVFPRDLVRRVRDGALHVLFEGNNLTCDCVTRPLKHLVSRLTRRELADEEGYAALRCAEPAALAGLTLAEVPEERLQCAAGPPPDLPTDDDPLYGVTAEPDVVFRDVQCSQTAVFVSWLVASARDVAEAALVVRGADNAVLHRETLPYHVRSATLPVAGPLRRALEDAGAGSLQVCVLPMTSEGRALDWHETQCRQLEGRFSSWPRKLSVDKRRLSGRRRAGGGALALVGDSILLTLCIFLGVCFRRLADLDL